VMPVHLADFFVGIRRIRTGPPNNLSAFAGGT
jgi:hypothetical protein